jgi:hypothetical protein
VNAAADEWVPVLAGWALWGKQPGTRQDYSVLACSPQPFSREEFEAIITRFAVGSPDVTAAGPAALPWVTVSWVGVEDDPHLGISITSHTGEVDGVGRPITQTAYFCIPYAQLAETPVSYCDLHDAVVRQAASLRSADGPLLQFAVPAFSAERMADTVRRVGEQTAMATAALLLAGPVAVAQAEGTALRDRLEFIDAVASLLPFGYRVRFSGATWSDNGTKHRVRLAFAARPREDAAAVQWQRRVSVPAFNRVAYVYSDRLRRLASDPARSPGAVGLPGLIAHLAADSAPHTFERSEDAFASLNRLDLPFRLVRAARDRAGLDVHELRQFLQGGRLRELPGEADRIVLLTALAENAATQDWPLLSAECDRLRDPSDGLGVLAAFGRRMLWATDPSDGGRALDCLRYGTAKGFADTLLAELLQLPRHPAPPGLRAVAGLLSEIAAATGSTTRSYPHSVDLLLANPALTARYAAQLSGTGRAGSVLKWLDPQGTLRVTRTFRIALGSDAGTVDPAAVAELYASDIDVVGALLQAASAAARLESVVPGFARWLAGRGQLDAAESSYWGSQLPRLRATAPRERAWLDTVLLITGNAPTALPPAQHSAATAYANDLAGIWSGLLGESSTFDGESCADGLARFLAGQPWTATAQQARAVTALVELLHDFDQRRVLATTVAAALAATPAARQWDFAADWLAWAEANRPEAIRERVLDALAAAGPAVDSRALARLCLQACREGISLDAVGYQLAKSATLTDATRAHALLTALREEFGAAGIEEETMLAWEFGLTELFARGDFGAELGHQLRGLVSERVRQNMWLQLRLLATVAWENGDQHYEWGTAERDDLAALAGEIESMLKKSRKFQLPKLRMPSRGGSPDETEAVTISDGTAVPNVTGPNVTGPNVTGPNVTGPNAAGPNAAGPGDTVAVPQPPQ